MRYVRQFGEGRHEQIALAAKQRAQQQRRGEGALLAQGAHELPSLLGSAGSGD